MPIKLTVRSEFYKIITSIVRFRNDMIWGVYIEIYILWEPGYLIDSPLILYIHSTADGKKCFAKYSVWAVAFADRDGYAVWHGVNDSR